MCIGKYKIAVFIVVVCIISAGILELPAQEISDTLPGRAGQGMCNISFTGQASGGTLILYKYLGGKAKCAAVETTAGESAEKVISRLANVIDETNPFGWMIVRGGRNETGARIVTSSGGILKGLAGDCGPYIIAGTEIGLGIPQPPHFLTCNYNPEANTISLKWVNPSPGEYDSIKVMFHSTIAGITLPGKSENYTVNLNDYSYSKIKDSELGYYIKIGLTPQDALSNIAGDLNIWIYGVRNGIPSNAAVMHLNNNIQEELYGVPFTSDIAPNWQPWVLDTDDGRIRLKEGIRKEYTKIATQQYDPVKTPETKPFYQIINTGPKGGTGGVFRKFVGLTPGHTYRVKARVATLNEPNEKNWSVSVHTALNGPDGRDLSPRQMAGLDALPLGEKGVAAGRIALYDSPQTTKGNFAEISTGKTVDGQENKDITLPAGVDSITVWVKCASSAGLSAAIDWISLEDLSAQKP